MCVYLHTYIHTHTHTYIVSSPCISEHRLRNSRGVHLKVLLHRSLHACEHASTHMDTKTHVCGLCVCPPASLTLAHLARFTPLVAHNTLETDGDDLTEVDGEKGPLIYVPAHITCFPVFRCACTGTFAHARTWRTHTLSALCESRPHSTQTCTLMSRKS